MRKLVLLALFGAAAQLVDGGLGMAYGLTSSTLLIAFGLAPAVASASVHLAEVGTTLASGVAHTRVGNTDWRTVRWLAVPGAIGAFSGAVVLSNLNADAAKPIVSGILLVLGVYLFVRFALLGGQITVREGTLSPLFLVPLGTIAGFLDAVGGGGWGPISTPSLLASGKMEPRKAVGTVSTSEFLVALAASIGFLVALDTSVVALPVVGALLVGGIIAAPLAATLVKYLNPRILGTMVGGLIIFTNGRTVLKAVGLSGTSLTYGLLALGAIWIVGLVYTVVKVRQANRTAETEGVLVLGTAD